MTDRERLPQSGEPGVSELPRIMWELLPEARSAIAWPAVNAYRAAPWLIDMNEKPSPAGTRGEHSISEAILGSQIISSFLPYSLVYEGLAPLLCSAARGPERNRSLLMRCAKLASLVLAEDFGLREALEMYIAEDMEDSVVAALAEYGDGRVNDVLEEQGRLTPGQKSGSESPSAWHRVFDYPDMWEAPYRMMSVVPEIGDHLADRVSQAFLHANLKAGLGQFDSPDNYVGKSVRRALAPPMLVMNAVDIAEGALKNDSVDENDFLVRFCNFVDRVLATDVADGAYLTELLRTRFSRRFALAAIESYRRIPEASKSDSVVHGILERASGSGP